MAEVIIIIIYQEFLRMESTHNNLIIRNFDSKGLRPDEFYEYFMLQPLNSVAIFFKSSENEADHVQKFRDMLVRAN